MQKYLILIYLRPEAKVNLHLVLDTAGLSHCFIEEKVEESRMTETFALIHILLTWPTRICSYMYQSYYLHKIDSASFITYQKQNVFIQIYFSTCLVIN